MKILNQLKQKAKKINATIILPEANVDKRVYDACKIILKQKLCKIVVFGKEQEFDKSFKNSNCQIIDIDAYNKTDFTNQLFELRQSKGLTKRQATNLVKKPLYFAMMMLVNNMADGVVAGAANTTADVLRPALQIVKAQPNKKIVTGSTLMLKDNCAPLLYGDVSLIENPDSKTLAQIAISNAEFMQNVVGVEPKVALLSYSTLGSASHEMVEKVCLATKIAKQNSNFLIDGEMQADSALNADTAKHKGVTSPVGGNANVLIYPDLNAGNIAYKLTVALGQYKAVGPIMLNFNKPVNDLSRGSTVAEIVETVIITKLQTKF